MLEPAISAVESPYVGLQPYTEAEREYFFGRQRDRRIIGSNLYASKLTVLYGESGVGKSSVLMAGVVPDLRAKAGTAVVVFREWQRPDFLPELKYRCVEAVNLAHNKPYAIDLKLPLDELLRQAGQASGDPIVVILDQFEEYFLYHPGTAADQAFEAEFARAVNRDEIDVGFLIAMREDALGRLDRFRVRIPHVLRNPLRLRHLDSKAAEEAIRGPLTVWNAQHPSEPAMAIEDALVQEIIAQVRTGQDLWGKAQATAGQGVTQEQADRVETPLLQLVLTRLWNVERARGGTMFKLATLTKELGGVRRIVQTHFSSLMETLSPEARALCATFFDRLVTPSGSKIACRQVDLTRWATEAVQQRLMIDESSRLQLAERLESIHAAVEDIVKTLAANRILRGIAPPPGDSEWRYEIFHDVLAGPILSWRDGYNREQEQIRDLAATRAEAAQRDKELAAARALAEVERAAHRKARGLALAMGLAFILAVLAGLATFWQSQKARLAEQRYKQAAEIAAQEAKKAAGFAMQAEEQRAAAIKQARAAEEARAETEQAFLQLAEATKAAKREEERALTAEKQARAQAEAALMAKTRAERLAAEKQRALMEVSKERSIGFARELAGTSRNVEDDDPELSVLLALEAVRQKAVGDGGGRARHQPEAEAALRRSYIKSRLQRIFPDQPERLILAATRPGERAISLDAAGNGKLWDTRSGKLVREARLSAGRPRLVALSPEAGSDASGRFLAVLDQDNLLRLTDLVSLEPVPLPDALTKLERVGAIALSRDAGKLAISACAEASAAPCRQWSVRLWDRASGSATALEAQDETAEFQALAFGAGDDWLAAGSQQGKIALWDLTGSAPQLRHEVEQSGAIAALAFSPAQIKRTYTIERSKRVERKESRLLAVGAQGEAMLWTVQDGLLLRPLPLAGHRGAVTSAAISADGERIATGGSDGQIGVFSAWSGQLRRFIPAHTDDVTALAFDAAGVNLLSGGRDRALRLWDADSGPAATIGAPRLADRACAASDPGAPRGAPRAVAFGPRGDYVAIAGRKRSLELWDISVDRRPRELDLATDACHESSVAHVDVDPSGKYLASAGADGTARIWELGSGMQRQVLAAHQGAVNRVRFSPDGTLLATAGEDARVALWEVASGELVRSIALGSAANSLAFSPRGQFLATAERGGQVKLWDCGNGKQIVDLAQRGHTEPMSDVAFSPSGEQVGASSWDRTAHIWRVRGRLPREPAQPVRACSSAYALETASQAPPQEPTVLVGHKLKLSGIVFIDDERVATAGEDSTARIWDVASGKELTVFSGHRNKLTGIAYNAERNRIATTSLDGTVRVHEIWDIDTLVQKAKTRITRPMTDVECKRYLHLRDLQACRAQRTEVENQREIAR